MRREPHKPSLIFCLIISVVSTLIGMSGCTKQGFKVNESTHKIQAPGQYSVAPKVDFLLAVDDTGSMDDVLPQIKNQFPQFLKGIEGKGWNYHFAITPLTSSRELDQIQASKHDPEWNELWQAPFPGARMEDIYDGVAPWAFKRPQEFTHYLSETDLNSGLSGMEPGLINIGDALHERAPGTGLIRDEALLVVLVVGNGQDTSLVNKCERSDGVTVDCESAWYEDSQGKWKKYPPCTSYSQIQENYIFPFNSPYACGSRDLSLQLLKQDFTAVKGNASRVKFYAAVANTAKYCRGGYSYDGWRYRAMADAFGGKSYDICSTNISSVLDDLSNHLQVEKRSYRTRYLFLDTEPNVDSVVVTVYRNGDFSQAEVIPQDPNDGWTYIGYRDHVAAVDAPILSNYGSGFVIELHGSARLLGNDTADVQFTPAGAQNSVN